MSRHYDKQLKLRNKFSMAINDVFNRAIEYKLTHERILELLNNAYWQHEDRDRLTGYSDSYLWGYVTSQFKMIDRHYVEWRVKYQGKYMLGKFIPKGEWDKVEKGEFFWIGTDKFYTLPE